MLPLCPGKESDCTQAVGSERATPPLSLTESGVPPSTVSGLGCRCFRSYINHGLSGNWSQLRNSGEGGGPKEEEPTEDEPYVGGGNESETGAAKPVVDDPKPQDGEAGGAPCFASTLRDA